MGGIPASLVRFPKARAVTGAPGFQRFPCHCLEWPAAKHLLMSGAVARCVSEPAGEVWVGRTVSLTRKT
jgi:hypothetical protein